MFPPDIYAKAKKIIASYEATRRKIVTAESCTGGLVSAALTAVPGSSAVVERGFVSYSNDAKTEVLGVMPDLLARFGAVSPEVAEAMAKGALDFSRADVAVSVTGIAGPDGGTPSKPVGLVCFGLATHQNVLMHYQCQFFGSRDEVRMQSVSEALKLFLSIEGEENHTMDPFSIQNL